MYQRSILVLTLLTVILVIVPMHASAQSENMMATVETKSGNFVIEFFPDVAPSHVNNFITLSQDGFYDGTVFHRVINGFMIQGGDPNTKDPELISLWGTGGPDHSVDAEFNDISHERGIVSMARSSNPNSAGSQFFIVHEDASFLDGQYTVFGRIVCQGLLVMVTGKTPFNREDASKRMMFYDRKLDKFYQIVIKQ